MNEKGYWEAEISDSIVMAYIPNGIIQSLSGNSEFLPRKPGM